VACEACAPAREQQWPWAAEPAVWVAITFSCAVSAGLIGAAASHFFQVRKLVRAAPSDNGRAGRLLAGAIRQLNWHVVAEVRVIDAPCTPLLWAGSRPPAILLPRQLADTLSEEALRGILLHELAHLVRRDPWTNLLAFAATCLMWWHPLVWFARRQMAEAAETCCDALAIEGRPGSRGMYAQTLLTVVDSLAESPTRQSALGLAFGQSRSLRNRIELIADRRVSPRLGRGGWALLAAAFVLLLGLAGVCALATSACAASSKAVPPVATQPESLQLDTRLSIQCCPS
jgi:beta-lactamase regulating signal transducer with metallopeptidase domain